jgi:hypothetical protein
VIVAGQTTTLTVTVGVSGTDVTQSCLAIGTLPAQCYPFAAPPGVINKEGSWTVGPLSPPADTVPGTVSLSAWVVDALGRQSNIVGAVITIEAPPPPDISGTWQEDQYSLVSSSCYSVYTSFWFNQVVANPPTCDYQLSQNGSNVTETVECASGQTFVGSVDSAGLFEVSIQHTPLLESGCTENVLETDTVPASYSPTTRTFTYVFTFSGTQPGQGNGFCGYLSNCTIVAQARWTKIQ